MLRSSQCTTRVPMLVPTSQCSPCRLMQDSGALDEQMDIWQRAWMRLA
jgi:hypothetical protein